MYKFSSFIIFLFLIILTSSCSDYQKLLNNGTTLEKIMQQMNFMNLVIIERLKIFMFN